MRPPLTITLKFCPVCERTDRFTSFTGKSHYDRGARCTGTPVEITYRVVARIEAGV